MSEWIILLILALIVIAALIKYWYISLILVFILTITIFLVKLIKNKKSLNQGELDKNIFNPKSDYGNENWNICVLDDTNNVDIENDEELKDDKNWEFTFKLEELKTLLEYSHSVKILDKDMYFYYKHKIDNYHELEDILKVLKSLSEIKLNNDKKRLLVNSYKNELNIFLFELNNRYKVISLNENLKDILKKFVLTCKNSIDLSFIVDFLTEVPQEVIMFSQIEIEEELVKNNDIVIYFNRFLKKTFGVSNRIRLYDIEEKYIDFFVRYDLMIDNLIKENIIQDVFIDKFIIQFLIKQHILQEFSDCFCKKFIDKYSLKMGQDSEYYIEKIIEYDCYSEKLIDYLTGYISLEAPDVGLFKDLNEIYKNKKEFYEFKNFINERDYSDFDELAIKILYKKYSNIEDLKITYATEYRKNFISIIGKYDGNFLGVVTWQDMEIKIDTVYILSKFFEVHNFDKKILISNLLVDESLINTAKEMGIELIDKKEINNFLKID